jgi:transposase
MGSGLELSAAERGELEGWARSRRLPAAQVKRARMLLLLEQGLSWNEISARTPCSPDFIARWKRRFERERLAGLHARHRGKRPAAGAARLRARILAWTQQRLPADGSTHWSTRKLGKALGVSHMMVARVWAEHGLQPHRLEHYMASDDPDFETKAADIIGLYLDPPARAAVFCVDEKTAIQALDRTDPVLPLSPGRAERHGFEYYRHGTLSLYAAFNTQSGKVMGRAVARHTSAEFVAFLTDLVANQPKEIHIICDNSIRNKE